MKMRVRTCDIIAVDPDHIVIDVDALSAEMHALAEIHADGDSVCVQCGGWLCPDLVGHCIHCGYTVFDD